MGTDGCMFDVIAPANPRDEKYLNPRGVLARRTAAAREPVKPVAGALRRRKPGAEGHGTSPSGRRRLQRRQSVAFIKVQKSALLKRPHLQYPAPIIDFFEEIWPNLGNLSRHNAAGALDVMIWACCQVRRIRLTGQLTPRLTTQLLPVRRRARGDLLAAHGKPSLSKIHHTHYSWNGNVVGMLDSYIRLHVPRQVESALVAALLCKELSRLAAGAPCCGLLIDIASVLFTAWHVTQ
jgi:hypothetical protein